MSKLGGAGILIIEQNYYSIINKRSEPAVILFGSPKGVFQDIGGVMDKEDKYDDKGKKLNKNKTIAKTAAREAREESHGLIDIDYRKVMLMPYFDLGRYRVFVMVIKAGHFYSRFFYHNRIIKKKEEIIDVARFYITDLIATKLRYNHNIICVDTKGQLRIIRDRTVKLLQIVLSSVIYKVIDTPLFITVSYKNNKYKIE